MIKINENRTRSMFAAEIQEKTNTTNMSGTGMRVDVDSSMKYFNDVNKQE
jgi:hypothetical protein